MVGQPGEDVGEPGARVDVVEVMQEQAAEHPRQHPDRKEEPWPAGDPALPVWRNAAARDEKVNMRMVQQILSPRVQHAEETDLRAEMLRIGGDGAQGL